MLQRRPLENSEPFSYATSTRDQVSNDWGISHPKGSQQPVDYATASTSGSTNPSSYLSSTDLPSWCDSPRTDSLWGLADASHLRALVMRAFQGTAEALFWVARDEDEGWDIYVLVPEHAEEIYKRVVVAEDWLLSATRRDDITIHVRATQGRPAATVVGALPPK